MSSHSDEFASNFSSNGSDASSGRGAQPGANHNKDGLSRLFEPGGIFDFFGFGLDEDSQSSDDLKAKRAQPISVADSPAVADEIERLVAKADELVDRSRIILRDAPECRADFLKGVFEALQLTIADLRNRDRSIPHESPGHGEERQD